MRIPLLRPFAAALPALCLASTLVWPVPAQADPEADAAAAPQSITAATLPGTAAPQAVTPPADAVTVTWDQAVSQALQHNPALASARLAVKQAEEGVTIADAGYYPSLNATAGISRTETQALSPLAVVGLGNGQTAYGTGYSGGLQASWNLFNGFGSYFAAVHARQLLAQAKAQYATASATLLLNLRMAFNQLLYDQKNVVLLKQISDRYHKDTLYEQLEFQSGQTARWTFLKSQSDEASFNWSLHQNDLNLKADQANLANFMGQDPSTAGNLAVDGTMASDVPPDEDAQDWARIARTHPSVVAQQALVEVNRANLGQQYAVLYPSLNAQASAGYSGGDTWGPDEFQATGSLNLSFNLFNGGGNLAAVHQAQAQLDGSRQDLQTLLNQLRAGLDKAWATYKADVDRLPTTVMATKAGAERFETVGILYTAGRDQYLDYEQAEQIYTSAQQQELSDRMAAAQAEAGYQNALGLGLEDIQSTSAVK